MAAGGVARREAAACGGWHAAAARRCSCRGRTAHCTPDSQAPTTRQPGRAAARCRRPAGPPPPPLRCTHASATSVRPRRGHSLMVWASRRLMRPPSAAPPLPQPLGLPLPQPLPLGWSPRLSSDMSTRQLLATAVDPTFHRGGVIGTQSLLAVCSLEPGDKRSNEGHKPSGAAGWVARSPGQAQAEAACRQFR